MLRRLILSATLAFAAFAASAQQELPLYPTGKIPYNLPNAAKTVPKAVVNANGQVTKIAVPSLTYYAPAGKGNGGAIMVMPGGGYGVLDLAVEGTQVAEYLTKLGYAAFVLNYRLPDSTVVENQNRRWVPFGDAIQGMTVIKDNAIGLGIDTNRVGVIGFSVGGQLAGLLATQYGRHPYGTIGARPAWTAMIYPITSMYNAHPLVRSNLLGGIGRIRPEVDSLFSPALHVSSSTPPAFVLACQDDDLVSATQQGARYADNLNAKGGKADLHIYAQGGHGFGLAAGRPGAVADWRHVLEAWLKGK